MFYIYLDIDGVLTEGPDYCGKQEKYSDHCRKYLSEKPQHVYPGVRLVYASFRAQTHYFNKAALKNLDALIAAIQKSGETVSIILSSNWRQYFDVKTIKILLCFKFSEFISDKIWDLSKIEDSQDYNLNRAETIELHLRLNREIKRFLIMDDCYAKEFNQLFPQNFVLCTKLFGKPELACALEKLTRLLKENPVHAGMLNQVTCKVAKTLGENRKCNERMQVSMRVLNEARMTFIKNRLEKDNTSPLQKDEYDGRAIANIITDYEGTAVFGAS